VEIIPMTDENKRNLQYFEADSMAGLFEAMQTWQEEEKKRFLSMDIQSDRGRFCCIALTNPSEVVLVDKSGRWSANVDNHGELHVTR
jgi:hypothetical protein